MALEVPWRQVISQCCCTLRGRGQGTASPLVTAGRSEPQPGLDFWVQDAWSGKLTGSSKKFNPSIPMDVFL